MQTIADFSLETMENRDSRTIALKYWIFLKSCQGRILCQVKNIFRNKGEMKKFCDKETPTQYFTSKPSVQEMFNIFLQAKQKYFQGKFWNFRNKWKTLEMVKIWVNIYSQVP